MASGGLIGALRVTLSADTAAFSTGMGRARKEAATSSSMIQRSLGGIKTAFAGIAAGLTVGTLVALVDRGLKYAGALEEISQQLGITTTGLQELRYAATQTGVAQEQLDKGIAKLTLTMSQARGGAEAPKKAFEELSRILGKDVLKAGVDANEMLSNLAEAYQKTGKSSDFVAIGAAVMGRGFQKLMPLLDGGREGVDQLRKAAHDLGIVLSEEQIQNADKTADKLDQLKMVLEANIAGAVADNAASIFVLVDALAQFVGWVGKAIEAWERMRGAFGGAGNLLVTPGALPMMAAREMARGAMGLDAKGRKKPSGGVGYVDPKGGVTVELGAMPQVGTAATGGVSDFLASGGGGGRKGKSAEQLAAEAARKREEMLRRAFDIDRQLTDAKTEELRAEQDLLTDYVERQGISHQLIDIETDQQNKQLSLAVQLGDLDAVTAEQLTAANERLRILKKQAENQQVELDRQRDFEATEQTRYGIQREQLDGERALAETAAERRRVEMEILDLAYREKKERLDRIVAQSQDEEERKRAQMELAAMPGQRSRDEGAVRAGTRGPLEDFLNTLPDTADKANEALQSIAAEGLQSLTDGITDAIMGARSLGEVFSSVAKQIIAELIKIAVQKAIVGSLGNVLGGLFGGGGLQPGDISGMMAANPGTFATGGGFTILGKSGVDTNILSLNGMPIAKVSHGERIGIDPSNDNGGRRGGNVTFDLRGAVMTEDILRQINQMGEVATIAGSHRAIQKMGKAKRRALA